MNERIQQLIVDTDNGQLRNGKLYPHIGSRKKEDWQRFAEALIRDCAKICLETAEKEFSELFSRESDGARVCYEKIKQHFGEAFLQQQQDNWAVDLRGHRWYDDLTEAINRSEQMTKTVVFQSEPGIVINGSEFEIRRTEWIDQQGQLAHYETAWGRDGNTCGWFFVPPIERARLEGLGVKFSLWLS